jgi:dTDP-4-dehydrorhamnose 3,5-epimerase
MVRFNFILTPLTGLVLLQRKAIEDHRGFFSRFYCAEELREVGLIKTIAQINHSLTCKKGTVRGMHFQYPPHDETKLVSCFKGKILDVAIDLRYDSPTFLHSHSEILSAANRKSMLIPEGFAHGFQTLAEDCELIYLHTASYHQESEGALNVVDPKLNIAWPLPIISLTDRDRDHPFINSDFRGNIL